jgi:hypothetical protein
VPGAAPGARGERTDSEPVCGSRTRCTTQQQIDLHARVTRGKWLPNHPMSASATAARGLDDAGRRASGALGVGARAASNP